MIHRREIINWLVYWQMGSCGRNCREKVQREQVTNRSSGPTRRRGTVFWSFFFLFSFSTHQNNTASCCYSWICAASNTCWWNEMRKREEGQRRDVSCWGCKCPHQAGVRAEGEAQTSCICSGAHTSAGLLQRQGYIKASVRRRGLFERALSYTHSLFMSKL